MRKATRFLVRHAGERYRQLTRGPLWTYTGNRHMGNLWTGYEQTRKGKAVALLGAAGFAGYAVASGIGEYEESLMYANANPEIQQMPALEADYVYNQVPPLEVPGSINFAMHNLRHGGWL